MEKDFVYTELYEEYSSLLTENQAEIFDLYYLKDLSLSEISEIKGISRQGVNDCILKARESLLFYESKLRLYAKREELKEFAKGLTEEEAKKLLAIIGGN